MDDLVIKHLEFIQNIINRMSNNSFVLKGWTVTVSSAVLALAIGIPKPFFAFIALFSSLAFWGLDAYYLCQEDCFVVFMTTIFDKELWVRQIKITTHSVCLRN